MVFDRHIGVAARCKFIYTPQGLRINTKREFVSGGAGNPPFFDGVSLWGGGIFILSDGRMFNTR